VHHKSTNVHQDKLTQRAALSDDGLLVESLLTFAIMSDMYLYMDTLSLSPNHHRVIRWIRLAGGEISRSRLRRYRPTAIRWQPIESALLDLIQQGIVEVRRNELEPLERGHGPVATRYRLTLNGAN
jgi:hypothetical protein